MGNSSNKVKNKIKGYYYKKQKANSKLNEDTICPICKKFFSK